VCARSWKAIHHSVLFMFQTNKTDADKEEEGKKQKITLFHDFTFYFK
jgi:5'-deoxynucleotidase YfbR-like HD superfamily hydrolase